MQREVKVLSEKPTGRFYGTEEPHLDKRTRIMYIANHGDHGETVITGVCGTSITGSIPVGRPIEKLSVHLRVF